MADGDQIPGSVCSRCGSGLVAIMLDVGYAEGFCPKCDLHDEWIPPIYPHRVKYTYTDSSGATMPGEMVVNAENRAEAWAMVLVYRKGLRDLRLDRVVKL